MATISARIPEIAKAYNVSELFLFKILQPLAKAGLVETVRGRNGGVRLGRAADQMTLYDVVKVTEDSFSMAECFDGGRSIARWWIPAGSTARFAGR